jgi:hypothetical protein
MNSKPNDDKYKNSESVVLSLENLNAQYTNVLIEYRQAVTNYVSFLKDETNTPANQKMVNVPNAAYWGETAISLNNSSTLQECSASCATTNGCSGATYNPTAEGQPMCWLRGGDSNLTTGMENDYAIIPEGKQLLLTVQMLNQRLSDINTQIQTITTSGQTDYDSQSIEREQNTVNLARQFIILNEEREKIERAINDYQTVDQQQTTGGLIVNKNYFSFILLLLLAIMIIFILYKFGLSPATTQPSSAMYGGMKVYSSKYFIYSIIVIIFFAFVFMYNSKFNTSNYYYND